MQEDGLRLGGEYLAAHMADDGVIRLYTTNGRELNGRDEVRAFYADAERSGASVILRAKTIEEEGDTRRGGGVGPLSALGGRLRRDPGAMDLDLPRRPDHRDELGAALGLTSGQPSTKMSSARSPASEAA